MSTCNLLIIQIHPMHKIQRNWRKRLPFTYRSLSLNNKNIFSRIYLNFNPHFKKCQGLSGKCKKNDFLGEVKWEICVTLEKLQELLKLRNEECEDAEEVRNFWSFPEAQPLENQNTLRSRSSYMFVFSGGSLAFQMTLFIPFSKAFCKRS